MALETVAAWYRPSPSLVPLEPAADQWHIELSGHLLRLFNDDDALIGDLVRDRRGVWRADQARPSWRWPIRAEAADSDALCYSDPRLTTLHPPTDTIPGFEGYLGFFVGFRNWQPQLTARAVSEQRMLAEAAAAIGSYHDAVEEQLRRAGWQTTSTKRRSHFALLAAYQCLGLDYRQLADRYAAAEDGEALTTQAIERAVKETAALIGLTLRPGRRGRPLGRKYQLSEARA